MSEIICPVCFRHCRLREGQLGFCRGRKNEGGKSICENYGKLTSIALDPIEKKPLARFFPGSLILSVGSFGCNMDCPFCQNDSISCADEQTADWRYMPPEELAALAQELRPRGNIGVAFTYCNLRDHIPQAVTRDDVFKQFVSSFKKPCCVWLVPTMNCNFPIRMRNTIFSPIPIELNFCTVLHTPLKVADRFKAIILRHTCIINNGRH